MNTSVEAFRNRYFQKRNRHIQRSCNKLCQRDIPLGNWYSIVEPLHQCVDELLLAIQKLIVPGYAHYDRSFPTNTLTKSSSGGQCSEALPRNSKLMRGEVHQ